MTHSDFHRVNNAIKSTYDTGKFPRGINTLFCFREFERIVNSYLNHIDDTTIDSEAVQALQRYNVPLEKDGIGWRLHYVR